MPPTGGQTALVVEDEEPLAVLMARYLERLGCRVLYARDGGQARQVVAQLGGELSLVLVDCGLPDISGAELCSEIRAALPGVALLLTSGRDQTALAAKFANGGPAGFLPKPFHRSDIEHCVGELFARAA
ncbi:MAG TPA: response regulator [Opitutus sp.]|nr:response regulator [Opitutus sp.]